MFIRTLHFVRIRGYFQVNWHPVFWGMAIQYIFALIIIRTSWGYDAFDWLGARVTELLAYSNAGAIFVFGDAYEEHFFAFKVLHTFLLSPMLRTYPIGEYLFLSFKAKSSPYALIFKHHHLWKVLRIIRDT